MLIKAFIKDLKNEFYGYSLKTLQGDLLAGITVAAVALPLALAFGVGSGADAAAGLITALIAGIIIGSLSGAGFQISGPTGAMTAILMSVIIKYNLEGMFAACLIAGVIMILAGLFKFGKLISFIPTPVISGFTSGIAIVIALSQADAFFGVHSEGETVVQKLFSYFHLGFNINWHSVLIGLFVILFMVFWKKEWNNRVPGSLLAIAAALVMNMIFNFPVKEVGEIPKTLILAKRLDLFNMPWQNINNLLLPAFSIAALGIIESLLCGVAGSRMSGKAFNADRELVAQGIGNVIIPFFGGVPATAAIARTSVLIKSGGVTRVVSIIHAVLIMIFMLLLGGVMARIPLSALAGVLIVTAFRMNEWEEIKFIFGKKLKSAMSKFLITMVFTVMFDLTVAIAAGVIFSAFMFVLKSANMDIVLEDIDKNKLEKHGIKLTEKSGQIAVAYISGPLFFGTAEKLYASLENKGHCDLIILSMRGVPMIDVSGLRGLIELKNKLEKENVTIMFAALQPKVLNMLERSGVIDEFGRESVFWSTDKAILAYVEAQADCQ